MRTIDSAALWRAITFTSAGLSGYRRRCNNGQKTAPPEDCQCSVDEFYEPLAIVQPPGKHDHLAIRVDAQGFHCLQPIS